MIRNQKSSKITVTSTLDLLEMSGQFLTIAFTTGML